MLASVFALIGLLWVSRAAADDPVACEAARLHTEERQVDCMGRCERRASRLLDPEALTDPIPTEAALYYGRISLCQERCDHKYDAAMTRVGRAPMCGGDGSAAAQRDLRICDAVLLRARIRKLVCDTECFIRVQNDSSYDQAACAESCEQRYNARVTNVIEQPACAGMHGDS